MICNTWHSNNLLHFNLLSYKHLFLLLSPPYLWLSLCYVCMFMLATVLLLWVMTDKVWVLTDFMEILICICLCCFSNKQSSQLLSSHSLMVTISLTYPVYPADLVFKTVSHVSAYMCVGVLSNIAVMTCFILIVPVYPSNGLLWFYIQCIYYGAIIAIGGHFHVFYSHITLYNGLWDHWVNFLFVLSFTILFLMHTSTVIGVVLLWLFVLMMILSCCYSVTSPMMIIRSMLHHCSMYPGSPIFTQQYYSLFCRWK